MSSFAFGYLDDILIFSETVEKHFKHLRTVFDRLRMAGLKLKRKTLIPSSINYTT